MKKQDRTAGNNIRAQLLKSGILNPQPFDKMDKIEAARKHARQFYGARMAAAKQQPTR